MENDVLKKAVEHSAAPTQDAAAHAAQIAPEAPEPDFDPRKFLNPETGEPYTFRGGKIYDPEKMPLPRMNPDGTPDLTVDGYLRKYSGAGKNKTLQKIGSGIKKMFHPKSDEEIDAEAEIEEVAQISEEREERLQIESVKIQQQESKTNSEATAGTFSALLGLIGGKDAVLSKDEMDKFAGRLYWWEEVRGRKIPTSPEMAVVSDAIQIIYEKFEKKSVQKTAKQRTAWLTGPMKTIYGLLIGFIPGVKAPKPPVAPVEAPAAPEEAPAYPPGLEPEEED